MNAKLLMIIGFLFFLAWKQACRQLPVCSVPFSAAGLCVCVLVYRMETTRMVADDDND
jgi:hypothetical protein